MYLVAQPFSNTSMAGTHATENVSLGSTALAVQVTDLDTVQKPLGFVMPQLISFTFCFTFHSSFPFYLFHCFHKFDPDTYKI